MSGHRSLGTHGVFSGFVLVACVLFIAACSEPRPAVSAAGGGGGSSGSKACTLCHGDATRLPTSTNPQLPAAPPNGTNGETSTSSRAVGAHLLHLQDGALRPAIACTECHVVPTSTTHSNGTAEVTFGALARTGGKNPSWSGTTCSNVYCHGSFTGGNPSYAPNWTSPAATTCGTCHALPPAAPHPQNNDCSTCHAGYTLTSVNPSLHLNGTVDVSALGCTACHGTTGVNAAPPVDTTGGSATTLVSVGAHQAHVASTLRTAIACTECHGAASASYTTTHSDGTVQVSFGTLSNTGTTTTWNRTNASCAASYSHGGTTAVLGGTGTTPVWTTVNGTYKACTSCHGNPPALSATTHHPANAACASCHGAGYTNAAVTGAALSTHVNGTVNKPANGCTACHGVLAGTGGAAVANTSATSAPGYNASAVDTAGNTAATFAGVGAHQAHLTGTRWRSTAIACSECHTVPASADVAHATGVGSGGARATMVFGTLAKTGLGTTASYAGSATAAGGSTAGTCSNVYCHGAFTGSGVTSSLSWTGGAAAANCGTCHGNPPPAPHSTSTACGSCHTGYTSTTVNATAHLNGTVDVANLSCTSCHGGVNAAPPVDTTGGSATTLVSVGAHQAHVASTLRTAMACTECHGAASATYTTSHSDGTVQVSFGTLSNTGTATVWNRTNASCAASYCHGGTTAVLGGTGTTPVWTTVNGTYKACTSCHGNPPALSSTTHHPANAACASCHGTGYTNSAVTGAALSTHVNGT